jgi:uncharacterized protein YndB with AHSA1/START domain
MATVADGLPPENRRPGRTIAVSQFTIVIEVNASPGSVFGYIADGTRAPEWYEAVRSVRALTDGPIGRGTRYLFTRALPQGQVDNEVEITEFDSPTLVTFTSVTGATPFVYRYRVEPDGSGARVSLEGEISGGGLRGPVALLSPIAGRLFARGMRANLRALQARLERRPGP